MILAKRRLQYIIISVLLLVPVLPFVRDAHASTVGVTYSGQLLYQVGSEVARPIPLARVRICSGLLCGGLLFDTELHPLQYSQTDEDGRFSITAVPLGDYCLNCYVEAWSESPGIVDVFDTSINPLCHVDDTCFQTYSGRWFRIASDPVGTSVDLGALTVSSSQGGGSDDAPEAFKILDSIVDARLFIERNAYVLFPISEVNVVFPCGIDDLCTGESRPWFDPFGVETLIDKAVGNDCSDLDQPQEQWCEAVASNLICSAPIVGSLLELICEGLDSLVLGVDPGRGAIRMLEGESRDTHIHEYGHFVMWEESRGQWPISIGDYFTGLLTGGCPVSHDLNLECGPAAAWTEGWADFLPLAVNNNPNFSDRFGSVNLESPPSSWPTGGGVEGRVAAALWDLYDKDPVQEGCADKSGVSFSSIFEEMGGAGVGHPSVNSFFLVYMLVHPELAHIVHAVAFQNNITDLEEGPPTVTFTSPQAGLWFTGRIPISATVADAESHTLHTVNITRDKEPGEIEIDETDDTRLTLTGTFGDNATFSYSTDGTSWRPIPGTVTMTPQIIHSETETEQVRNVDDDGDGYIDRIVITSTFRDTKSLSQVFDIAWDTTGLEGMNVWIHANATDEVSGCTGLSTMQILGPFGVDNTPPTVDGTVDRQPDSNGWYNQPVTISWVGNDLLSGIASCDPPLVYSGPDTASIEFNGQCTDFAGNTGSDTVVIHYDASPPETSITSAVDAQGTSVANGGITLFEPVTFTFAGSDATSGLGGFECSLDGSPFSVCSNPLNSGRAGTHALQVRAFDIAGNVDPTPSVFTWTLITPAQATQTLIDTVKGMSIPFGVRKSFLGPLTEALNVLTDTNMQNDLSACKSLDAFVILVNQYESHGQLTPAQAASLRLQATNIKIKLGCP